MSSNLPPGVTESMIPGNRPEDMAWESFYEWLDGECAEHGIDVNEAGVIFKQGLAFYLETKKELEGQLNDRLVDNNQHIDFLEDEIKRLKKSQ